MQVIYICYNVGIKFRIDINRQNIPAGFYKFFRCAFFTTTEIKHSARAYLRKIIVDDGADHAGTSSSVVWPSGTSGATILFLGYSGC